MGLVPLKVLNGIVYDFCFDKYGTLYASRGGTTLVVMKVNGDSNTIVIPFTVSIIPDYSGTGIYLLCYQNSSYKIYYQTEWNSFVDSPLYTSYDFVIGMCTDRDDNLHVLVSTSTNFEMHKLVNGNRHITIINNLAMDLEPEVILVGSLSDGSIIINYDGFLYIVVEEAENTDAVSIDSSVITMDSVIDSNDVIYSTGFYDYNNTFIYKFTKTGNSWKTEVVHTMGNWYWTEYAVSYFPTLYIDKHDKVYATDRYSSIYLVDNWSPIWTNNSVGVYDIVKMEIDPIYGEIYYRTSAYFKANGTWTVGGGLYVLEEPRLLGFKEFDLPSEKVFSLNIDHISQTEFFLGIPYQDKSFSLFGDLAWYYDSDDNPLITYELTYKPNDPLIVDQEIKIISAFNAYDTMKRLNEYQTWVENLQPDVSYIVSLRISTGDPAFYTYVSDELEIQTLAYNSPVVNMSININKDILLSLSTDPEDDPLPPDASYYIAYFQGTIPKQLIFHRVNGSLYILPDKSLLDKNKQLEVLAFIRYGYEIDDNDLIDDLKESVGTDKTIKLDNKLSNYSRRGVLTDDSFFLNL
jgi:hypothetical protein